MRESRSLHRQFRINDEGSYLKDTVICISIVFIIIVIVIIARQSCNV